MSQNRPPEAPAALDGDDPGVDVPAVELLARSGWDRPRNATVRSETGCGPVSHHHGEALRVIVRTF